MINTVLSQITGVFRKDFLFASFLPALILLSCVLGVTITIFGARYAFAFYDSMTASQKTVAAASFTLVTVVVAYLLNALRGTFISIWSGESGFLNWLFFGPVKLAELWQTSRYLRLRALSGNSSTWLDLAAEFRTRVEPLWSTSLKKPGWLTRKWMLYQAGKLHRGMTRSSVRARLEYLAEYFAHYSGEALRPLYERVNRELMDWDQLDSYMLQRCTAELDRRFGTLATVRATSLGNVIQSYNHYAYVRYCIEAEVFWPRLKMVVPEGYMEQVKQPKILLDFGVTMASISLVVAFSLLIVGPWLWFEPYIWGAMFATGIASAAFFYFLSVDAATQYGDMIRSCFDLCRLELLDKLSFERPDNLGNERAQWEKVSRLIVYGQESDLQLAGEKAP